MNQWLLHDAIAHILTEACAIKSDWTIVPVYWEGMLS